ncbi:transcriptional regulator with XRE-family HTH domain [Bradyrhizobium sp. USDA 4341]
MSGSADLIELALTMLGCTQKELAFRLKVSAPQITKWKNDEHMSNEMSDRIRKLIKIGQLDPSVILWAGSVDSANHWMAVFRDLAKLADDDSTTGYRTEAFDDLDWLSLFTVSVLNEMGVAPPKTFSESDAKDPDRRNKNGKIDGYAPLILEIYRSFTDVYGFYQAYVYELIFGDDDRNAYLFQTSAINIEPNLLRLAASKVQDIDEKFAPALLQFGKDVRSGYISWLTELKGDIVRMGVPLRAELMDMVDEGHDALGRAADAEVHGFNDHRVHPDIYMNELLMGVRFIRRALPEIMEKIGMDWSEIAALTYGTRITGGSDAKNVDEDGDQGRTPRCG